jgi:hypothetical protein
LVEEFGETLGINLKSEQYVYSPVTTIVEGEAAATGNIYARGNPTVRIYRIFEARITDSSLAVVMLKGSDSVSHQTLSERALADAEDGGKGRANGVLTLPWKRLEAIYQAMLPATRNLPIMFEENQLDVTVSAIFDHIAVPRYQRVVV